MPTFLRVFSKRPQERIAFDRQAAVAVLRAEDDGVTPGRKARKGRTDTASEEINARALEPDFTDEFLATLMAQYAKQKGSKVKLKSVDIKITQHEFDEAVRKISRLSFLEQIKPDCIRSLVVQDTMITNINGINRFPNIELVQINNCALTQPSARYVNDSLWLPKLKELDLSGNELKLVPILENLKSLLTLNLSRNKISANSVQRLKNATSLRTLDLSDNRLVWESKKDYRSEMNAVLTRLHMLHTLDMRNQKKESGAKAADPDLHTLKEIGRNLEVVNGVKLDKHGNAVAVEDDAGAEARTVATSPEGGNKKAGKGKGAETLKGGRALEIETDVDETTDGDDLSTVAASSQIAEYTNVGGQGTYTFKMMRQELAERLDDPSTTGFRTLFRRVESVVTGYERRRVPFFDMDDRSDQSGMVEFIQNIILSVTRFPSAASYIVGSLALLSLIERDGHEGVGIGRRCEKAIHDLASSGGSYKDLVLTEVPRRLMPLLVTYTDAVIELLRSLEGNFGADMTASMGKYLDTLLTLLFDRLHMDPKVKIDKYRLSIQKPDFWNNISHGATPKLLDLLAKISNAQGKVSAALVDYSLRKRINFRQRLVILVFEFYNLKRSPSVDRGDIRSMVLVPILQLIKNLASDEISPDEADDPVPGEEVGVLHEMVSDEGREEPMYKSLLEMVEEIEEGAGDEEWLHAVLMLVAVLIRKSQRVLNYAKSQGLPGRWSYAVARVDRELQPMMYTGLMRGVEAFLLSDLGGSIGEVVHQLTSKGTEQYFTLMEMGPPPPGAKTLGPRPRYETICMHARNHRKVVEVQSLSFERHPDLIDMIVATIDLIRVFARAKNPAVYAELSEDTRQIVDTTNDTLDKLDREAFLFHLLRSPSDDIRVAVVDCLQHVPVEQLTNSEVASLVSFLDTERVTIGRSEEVITKVLSVIIRVAERTSAAAGQALRKTHARLPLQVLRILKRNVSRDTGSRVEERKQKVQLSQACLAFLKEAGTWDDAERIMWSEEAMEMMRSILVYDQRFSEPGDDVRIEDTLLGENSQALLYSLAELDLHGRQAARVLHALARAMEGDHHPPPIETEVEGRVWHRASAHTPDAELNMRKQHDLFCKFEGISRILRLISDVEHVSSGRTVDFGERHMLQEARSLGLEISADMESEKHGIEPPVLTMPQGDYTDMSMLELVVDKVLFGWDKPKEPHHSLQDDPLDPSEEDHQQLTDPTQYTRPIHVDFDVQALRATSPDTNEFAEVTVACRIDEMTDELEDEPVPYPGGLAVYYAIRSLVALLWYGKVHIRATVVNALRGLSTIRMFASLIRRKEFWAPCNIGARVLIVFEEILASDLDGDFRFVPAQDTFASYDVILQLLERILNACHERFEQGKRLRPADELLVHHMCSVWTQTVQNLQLVELEDVSAESLPACIQYLVCRAIPPHCVRFLVRMLFYDNYVMMEMEKDVIGRGGFIKEFSDILHRRDTTRNQIRDLLAVFLSVAQIQMVSVFEFINRLEALENIHFSIPFVQELLLHVKQTRFQRNLGIHLMKNIFHDQDPLQLGTWCFVFPDKHGAAPQERVIAITNNILAFLKSPIGLQCNICPDEDLCPSGPRLDRTIYFSNISKLALSYGHQRIRMEIAEENSVGVNNVLSSMGMKETRGLNIAFLSVTMCERVAGILRGRLLPGKGDVEGRFAAETHDDIIRMMALPPNQKIDMFAHCFLVKKKKSHPVVVVLFDGNKQLAIFREHLEHWNRKEDRYLQLYRQYDVNKELVVFEMHSGKGRGQNDWEQRFTEMREMETPRITLLISQGGNDQGAKKKHTLVFSSERERIAWRRALLAAIGNWQRDDNYFKPIPKQKRKKPKKPGEFNDEYEVTTVA